METNIICPHCNTDMNSYKCEHTCNYCDTIYCLSCNEPFYNNNKGYYYKGHKKNCYIKNNKLLSKL
jgi:hypothetical protein